MKVVGRWWYFLILAVVLVVVGAVVAWRAAGAHGQLVGGTVFDDRQAAPEFALTDQFGQPTSLSQFHGRPVALTFIYTHCTDVCPLIASNMHMAYQQLGSQASQVALVAVTVDPQNDSVDQIRAFSDQRGLTDEWHFLTGSPDQLAPIWKSYGIFAQALSTPDQIEHSAPVYLIDQSGAERATLPDDFTADTLSQDLRVLLNGG